MIRVTNESCHARVVDAFFMILEKIRDDFRSRC